MAAVVASVVVDATEPELLAAFWCHVLGWARLGVEPDGSVEIGAVGDPGVTILFQPVAEPKLVKNRVHVNVRPSGVDQEEELDRLLALGARHVDVGQGDQTWVVLSDPEDNEFCLLRTRADHRPAAAAT